MLIKNFKTLKTKNYPTRYKAFKNPGTFVVNENPEHRGGYEYGYFYIPDLLTIEVKSFQGKSILVLPYSPYINAYKHKKEFQNNQLDEAIKYTENLLKELLKELYQAVSEKLSKLQKEKNNLLITKKSLKNCSETDPITKAKRNINLKDLEKKLFFIKKEIPKLSAFINNYKICN